MSKCGWCFIVFLNVIVSLWLFIGCGHCKRVKPEFTKAADHFKDDSRTAFVAIDCTIRQPLCSVNEVTGYPTIKYFSYLNKAVKSYSGGRTVRLLHYFFSSIPCSCLFQAEDFIAFMSNPDSSGSSPPIPKQGDSDKPSPPIQADSAAVELSSVDFKKRIAEREPTLVFFYATCKYVLEKIKDKFASFHSYMFWCQNVKKEDFPDKLRFLAIEQLR